MMTTKNTKLQLLQIAFSFGGTINPPTTKYSASEGNSVGTAAILEFHSFYVMEETVLILIRYFNIDFGKKI